MLASQRTCEKRTATFRSGSSCSSRRNASGPRRPVACLDDVSLELEGVVAVRRLKLHDGYVALQRDVEDRAEARVAAFDEKQLVGPRRVEDSCRPLDPVDRVLDGIAQGSSRFR